MSDTTFGRYAEIPFDRMTPEQQQGYRFGIDGSREDEALDDARVTIGIALSCNEM